MDRASVTQTKPTPLVEKDDIRRRASEPQQQLLASLQSSFDLF